MSKTPVFGKTFTILDGSCFSNITYMSPELIAAKQAHARLSEAEKVAVRLRHGNDVLAWWREHG